MNYKELSPYLNKIVQVNLKNKKRKIGWLVIDIHHDHSKKPLKEVHCVKVRFGEKHIRPNTRLDLDALKEKSEIFQIDDIMNIRACM